MFENNDFEIYEMSINLKVERHEKIKKNRSTHIADKKNFKRYQKKILRDSRAHSWLNDEKATATNATMNKLTE